MPTYHCAEGSSNKLWKYTLHDKGVTVEWGRVGLSTQSKAHSFSSDWERDRFIQKLVTEKTKKGYKEVTEEAVAQQVSIANKIGTQNKIARVEFCSRNGNKLTILPGYDPEEWVYVEVLDSWKKSSQHILMSKSTSIEISGPPEVKITDHHTFSKGDTFIAGIREHLKTLSEQVVKIVQKVFGLEFGARKLALSGKQEEEDAPLIDTKSVSYQSNMSSVLSSFKDSSASEQVISKFATFGARKLVL